MTDMNYNELRSWAAENDVDVSESPSLDELQEAYENHESGVERSDYDERVIG